MRITHCSIPTFIFPVSSSAQPTYAMPTFHILKPATHTQIFALHRAGIILATLLACLAPPAAKGHDDDRRFLIEHNRLATEQPAEAPAGLVAPPGTLLHQGRLYEISNHVDHLEPAIYMALNTGQWDNLAEFLGRYRLLRNHRPALVAMANALRARHDGDYPLALRSMRAAQAAEPGDARIQLELARLLFEDRQDANARKYFEQARSAALPDYARMLAGQYLSTLEARAGWRGIAAIGMGRNSNVNQANGHHSCLAELMNICLYERRMPRPIGVGMASYEISLERRVNLRGNHNLLMRPMVYGSQYQRGKLPRASPIGNYSSNTSLLYLGYQYLDARNDISVLPYLDHYYRDGYTNYLAGGLQTEWRHSLNKRWQLGAQLEAKRYRYRAQARRYADDNTQYQGGIFASYAPSPFTSMHAGLDFTRKSYAVPQASSKALALRTGIAHALMGGRNMYVNAQGIYRLSRNDAHDGFLGRRRADTQRIYMAAIGAHAWKIAGMTPELRIRHTVNSSNLDWAFGYKQTEITMQLRRRI